MKNTGVIVKDPKILSKYEFEKIYEIEKDMWARSDGLGEYIKCVCCGKILSKEDVFGHLSISILSETVSKIEKLLGISKVDCPSCGSNETNFLFGKDYKDEINDRYRNSESYLSLFYDNDGNIRGFMDGYIDNFDVIYEREFKNYYDLLGKDFIKKLIESSFGDVLPSEILFCSALGFEKKFINFITLIELLRSFYSNVNSKNPVNLGVTEVTLGTKLHYFHLMNGFKQVGVNDFINGDGNHNTEFTSDIFIMENMPKEYTYKLDESSKKLIIKFKKFLNSINV